MTRKGLNDSPARRAVGKGEGEAVADVEVVVVVVVVVEGRKGRERERRSMRRGSPERVVGTSSNTDTKGVATDAGVGTVPGGNTTEGRIM
jgi:hypothetical protein